eukprot:1730163-Pyramimonas_sp.AAC.1
MIRAEVIHPSDQVRKTAMAHEHGQRARTLLHTPQSMCARRPADLPANFLRRSTKRSVIGLFRNA